MSKLALKIQAEQLNDKRAAPVAQRMIKVEQEFNNAASHDAVLMGIQSKYRLKVLFGTDIWISESPTSKMEKRDLVASALTDARRAVVHEVFGEFRGILNEIRLASYEMDYGKVRELVSEMENRMFVEGLE